MNHNSFQPHAGSILLAETITESQPQLLHTLEEVGYQLRLAKTEETLIRQIQSSEELLLLGAWQTPDHSALCQAVKQLPEQQRSPILLMLAPEQLTQLPELLAAGADDYVLKPLRIPELVGRINMLLQRTRQQSQARVVMDEQGQATLAVDLARGRLLWQTPLARQLIQQFVGEQCLHLPEPLLDWLQHSLSQPRSRTLPSLTLTQGHRQLIISIAAQTDEQEWLLVLREEVLLSPLQRFSQHFRLTQRQAEVLYWLTQGKTSRDIADILQSSPRTVNKHLEAVYEKLGVETRTAAATRALGLLQQGN